MELNAAHSTNEHIAGAGGSGCGRKIQDQGQKLNIFYTFLTFLSHINFFSPGFPLTLALHSLPSLPTSMGYPVIHTTAKMGLFCSSGVSQTAVDTMCRNLGHRKGFKLPPSLLGQPANLPPQFVLQVCDQLNNVFNP